MKYIKILTVAATALFATTTQAEEFIDVDAIYVGAGLSSNSASGLDSAMGYQIFVGMPLNINMGSVSSALEVGYMDSGEMDACVNVPFFGTVCNGDNATGLWANYVAAMPVSEKVDVIGRLGLDFGDDDGLMLGVGAGYNIDAKMDVRAEYVIRDNINSLQVNLAYRLK